MLHFFEPNNISLHLSDLKIICESSSQRNKSIKLFNHKLLGKILVINGEIQHIEAWAPLYHENLVHIPASFVPVIKRVLILGGGSFFAAREVLRYNSVERVVMVDFDNEVVTIVNSNYPHAKSILTNEKFTLVIEDIHGFLKRNTEKFDLIVNDALDLLNNKTSYFDMLGSHLTKTGVCSDVIYRHIYENDRSFKTVSRLRKSFNAVFSLIVIPEYPGIMHLLSLWGKTNTLRQNSDKIINTVQKKWISNPEKNPCTFYDARFIKYYLYLPPYLRKWVTNL